MRFCRIPSNGSLTTAAAWCTPQSRGVYREHQLQNCQRPRQTADRNGMFRMVFLTMLQPDYTMTYGDSRTSNLAKKLEVRCPRKGGGMSKRISLWLIVTCL